MASDRLRMSLLPALHALLSTANVTRAAEMVHVTQSTMSHTLSQLRSILNDPLLIRDGNQFCLSKKGKQLQPQVDQLMAKANIIFEDYQFDPHTSQQHFRILTSTLFQEQFLLVALAKISKKAPGLTFSVATINKESIESLQSGESDLCFMQYSKTLPVGLQGRAVFLETSFLVVRKDHPLTVNGPNCLSDLDDYPFLGVDGPLFNEASVNRLKLKSKSLNNPWMMVDSFQAAKEVLTQNDAYSIIRENQSPDHPVDLELAYLSFPDQLPEVPFWILWPEHWEFSQSHQWLRKQMENELRQFYVDTGREDLLIS